MCEVIPCNDSVVIESRPVCFDLGIGKVAAYPPTATCGWNLNRSDPETFLPHIKVAKEFGVKTLWMLIPSKFNARIAHESECGLEVEVGGIRVMGKIHADGILIPKGDAFGLTSADCPTVVIFDKKKDLMMAMHAGRDCLIDTSIAQGKGASRLHFSVIDSAMFELINKHECNPNDLYLETFFGIKPKDFPHSFHDENHGKRNRKLVMFLENEYGKEAAPTLDDKNGQGFIDLFAIIKSQASKYSIPLPNITCDNINTASREGFASTRGGDKTRNFVIVKHR